MKNKQEIIEFIEDAFILVSGLESRFSDGPKTPKEITDWLKEYREKYSTKSDKSLLDTFEQEVREDERGRIVKSLSKMISRAEEDRNLNRYDALDDAMGIVNPKKHESRF